MRSRTIAVGTIAILAGLLTIAAWAQNQVQHQASAQQAMSHVNAADIVDLKGIVSSVSLAPGQGMPFLKLNAGGTELTIMIGPYRLLADNKFAITPGKEYSVKAFPDPRVADAYVAIEITNTETGDSITLRDAAGVPHAGARGMGMMAGNRGTGVPRSNDPAQARQAMHGMQGMRGLHGMQGMGGMHAMAADCPNCSHLDLKAGTTLSGIVQSVSIEAGQGFPSFTLLVSGRSYTILAGPYWFLQQAELAIANGDQLIVTGYPVLQQDGVLAAAEIQNVASQKSVKLRGDDGLPLWMGGRGPMHSINKK